MTLLSIFTQKLKNLWLLIPGYFKPPSIEYMFLLDGYNADYCSTLFDAMLSIVWYNADKCLPLFDIMLTNVPRCWIQCWQMFYIFWYHALHCLIQCWQMLATVWYNADKCYTLFDTMLTNVPHCLTQCWQMLLFAYLLGIPAVYIFVKKLYRNVFIFQIFGFSHRLWEKKWPISKQFSGAL